jgi:cystathionine beta-lyase/cystathionine gamma-synthase
VIPKCSGIPISEFNPEDPQHRYVRLYVGLEEADYLIKDLDQAFEKMNNN